MLLQQWKYQVTIRAALRGILWVWIALAKSEFSGILTKNTYIYIHLHKNYIRLINHLNEQKPRIS